MKQAVDEYPAAARGKIVIMYLYIVDNENRLLGVIDIKELLHADDETLLKDIMITTVISLAPSSTLKDASKLFERYDLRAIPVIDDQYRIQGVLPIQGRHETHPPIHRLNI